jgi:hypothetical protein
MAYLAHQPAKPRRAQHRRHGGPSPLAAPLLVFAGVATCAVLYVAYVLWPRWPDGPVSLDAPSLPIVVAGTAFNVEPAAIRRSVQRRPGAQERIDLVYLWPSLLPPDPAFKPQIDTPLDPNDRLFITVQVGDGTLPLKERAETIYPRYLADDPATAPTGLKARLFRDGTPYQGEELVFEEQAPEHFLARCSRKGVINSGSCLLERRIGGADVTIRFPRDWLSDWTSVADGIDRLMARLHPQP